MAGPWPQPWPEPWASYTAYGPPIVESFINARAYVRSQCSLCGFEFEPSDVCIPIIKYPKTSHLEAARPVTFRSITELEAEYYKRYFVLATQFSPLGLVNVQVTVHEDCFNIFLSGCTVEDVERTTYWVAELTQPWPDMPSLELDAATSISRGFGILSETYLPQLASLPAEIANQIYNYSRSHITWRYATVIDRVEQLNKNKDMGHLTVPVCEIQKWVRGKEPTLSKFLQKGIIRLTIDSLGLRKIERLTSRPQHQAKSFSDLAFILDTPRRFRKMTVEFRYGLAHLNNPGHPRLCIWDRPCPPLLQECKGFAKPSRCLLNRITTIDPKKCTGITVYFLYGVLAMQAHTTNDPKLPSHYNQTIGNSSCIYLPLPPGEEIQAVGAWMTPGNHSHPTGYRYFFRMKLAGDISIGMWNIHPPRGRKTVLAAGPNITLINYKNTQNRGLIATCDPLVRKRRIQFEASQPAYYPPLDHRSHPGFYYYVNYSTAPLKNVTRIRIFVHASQEHCNGIIFDYANGAQQALGECRFGIDPVTTTINPTAIRIYEHLFCPLTITAYTSTDIIPNPSEGIYPMRGRLECWFCESLTKIVYAA